MKRLTVLGSTGSIGRQTLEVAGAFPERFRVVGLAAKKNIDLLEEQIRLFHPELVAVEEEDAAKVLTGRVKGQKVHVLSGQEGIQKVAEADSDQVVAAMVGAAGLGPTLAAIRVGRNIALANKETLVMAGGLVFQEVEKHGVQLVPVDSEHCAIWQCLAGLPPGGVSSIILTASGGPFRETPAEEMGRLTPQQALHHPSWRMGPKITIDSATLMNKGLEVIEAHWLFQTPYEQIKVVVHPESIIHSMVETVDGAVLAQMAVPDMRLPIQYALSYPERWENKLWHPLNLAAVGTLHFMEPDFKKFPSLALAYEAGRKGGVLPAVLNGANEVAVNAYLGGRIGFLDIPRVVEACLSRAENPKSPALEQILAADHWARGEAERMVAVG